MKLSPDAWIHLGVDFMGSSYRRSNKQRIIRRFKSYYGTKPVICCIVWEMLENTGWTSRLTKTANPIHLLWTLRLLKSYNTESELAAEAGGKDEKTFRKWAWLYINGIATLASIVVSKYSLFYTCL